MSISVTHTFRAMGSPCSIHLFCNSKSQAKEAFCAVEAEVERLEQKYSRFRSDSYLSHINRSAGDDTIIIEDQETQALLDYAQNAWEQSGGLFDISSGLLTRLWDFKKGRIPTDQQINEYLQKAGWEKVRWDKPQLILPEGLYLDFGGCVKEYAADAAVSVLRTLGIFSGLVELGGDIAVLGSKPGGEAWSVGIRHPRREGALCHIGLSSGALASSGDYERCFVHNGKRYSHIINPKTARPAEGPASVSVIAENCIIAGTASTVAMCSTEDEAIEWLQSLGLPYVCVLQNGSVKKVL